MWRLCVFFGNASCSAFFFLQNKKICLSIKDIYVDWVKNLFDSIQIQQSYKEMR